jgi:hypothetical protein
MTKCKECPWAKSNPHSLKWREYSKKIMGDKPHACHMKTKDVWGKKTDISEIFCQGLTKIETGHKS